MKPFLPAMFFCLLSGMAMSQNVAPSLTIQGTVIDSATNKPMGFVTVALQNSKTHTDVKSGLTKDDGIFSLKVPADNSYEAVLVFVGYRNKIVQVSGSGTDRNIGKVLLSASSGKLKEVSISAARPLMKRQNVQERWIYRQMLSAICVINLRMGLLLPSTPGISAGT